MSRFSTFGILKFAFERHQLLHGYNVAAESFEGCANSNYMGLQMGRIVSDIIGGVSYPPIRDELYKSVIPNRYIRSGNPATAQ